MHTKLTWWIRAVSFVAVIFAGVKVIANVCHINAASIVTSQLVNFACYNAMQHDKRRFSKPHNLKQKLFLL